MLVLNGRKLWLHRPLSTAVVVSGRLVTSHAGMELGAVVVPCIPCCCLTNQLVWLACSADDCCPACSSRPCNQRKEPLLCGSHL